MCARESLVCVVVMKPVAAAAAAAAVVYTTTVSNGHTSHDCPSYSLFFSTMQLEAETELSAHS